MQNYNKLNNQVKEMLMKLNRDNEVPYSLVRTVENDFTKSNNKNDINEMKLIKNNIEKLLNHSFKKE